MRLDKYLSESTSYSRKEIKLLAAKGNISVNGKIIRKSDFSVSENDLIQVNGEKIAYRKFIYLMMNKPAGYLSATWDAKDPVVIELLPDEFKHYEPFPAGRLDKDTEGLLLLTNDGQFDHAVTSPRKNVFKRYFARLDQPAQQEDIQAFQAGMDLGDFVAKPAKLELTDQPCEVYVEVSEGKFHQVKRMCEKVGKKVVYLKRISIGELSLDSALASGEVRELSPAELALFGFLQDKK
ncbi:MAG: rRNA pseudouridine synthase [Lentisphaeria bacterium]|nr:rRNA pseudouridine synthase [Lentisphaeria bacterium]